MSELNFRPATREDVPRIVAMLADDILGAQREENTDPLPPCYYDAFEAIDSDPKAELVVAEIEGQVIGTLQLNILAHIARRGGVRGQIEAVRVCASRRGEGLGARFIQWAIDRSRERGCHMVQLTSDKKRTDALRFYEALGFHATHEGFKLDLTR